MRFLKAKQFTPSASSAVSRYFVISAKKLREEKIPARNKGCAAKREHPQKNIKYILGYKLVEMVAKSRFNWRKRSWQNFSTPLGWRWPAPDRTAPGRRRSAVQRCRAGPAHDALCAAAAGPF